MVNLLKLAIKFEFRLEPHKAFDLLIVRLIAGTGKELSAFGVQR